MVGPVIKENISFIDTSVSLPELTDKHRSYSCFLMEEFYWIVTLHSFPGKIAKVIWISGDINAMRCYVFLAMVWENKDILLWKA